MIETPQLHPDDVRDTVRALVTCLHAAASNPNNAHSPVDAPQLAHLRKVIKLLSFTETQIDDMPPDERQSVRSIRANAVHKMRMARAAQLRRFSASPPPMQASDPVPMMRPIVGFGGDGDAHAPAWGSAADRERAPSFPVVPMGMGGNVAQPPHSFAPGSAPATFCMPPPGAHHSCGSSSPMAPPSFYVRKEVSKGFPGV